MSILSLSSLSLHHFRNYEALRLEVSSLPVVLFGHNGAGKTNILEAISLLSPGRGLRQAKLAEIPRMGSDAHWVIAAHTSGIQGEATLGTGKNPEVQDKERRLVKIDGKIAPQSHLADHLSMLWLTPQTEQLFQEGASEGRRFLDRMVFNFDSEHARRVNAYEHAMRERNRLLEMGDADDIWLSTLEKTMAEQAASIASARLMTIQHVNHAIEASVLSFPKPLLTVAGVVEDLLTQGIPSYEAEQHVTRILAEQRRQDAAAGRALLGPHRSALVVTHRDKNMPAALCSTGEQKALIISIVLAQCRAALHWRGIMPILLLDEVVAHLDPARRLELFEEIRSLGAQTWMTGTDASLFNGMEPYAQFIKVGQGAANYLSV